MSYCDVTTPVGASACFAKGIPSEYANPNKSAIAKKELLFSRAGIVKV